MSTVEHGPHKPAALALLAGQRPRNVGWLQAAGLLFGDWGTSRLYVLGLAYFVARGTSLYLICMMSLLIMAVAWAYTQISRIYPDGGGVYTAAKHRNRTLAVIGALLLFADYTVTVSLSVLDGLRYFGLQSHVFLAWNSAALWGIVAICVVGLLNLMGPKHTGGVALWAAVAMVLLTLMVTAAALPQVRWHDLASRAAFPTERPSELWRQFVSIILALSGVEAIANLTGVMKRPVAHTARKAIWFVATEVAVFNILLAVCMVATTKLISNTTHTDDMMAFISDAYLGHWAEVAVRIVGGILLLSAGNTAITDMISIQYLMARDGELPRALQALNRFGVPWLPAFIAAGVPSIVIFIKPNVEKLSHLYAMGLVGALSINITLCALHPRLRRMRRKAPMLALGIFMIALWASLAYYKQQAVLFVSIVLIAGLIARRATKWFAARRPKPSLIRQAIAEQLTPEAMAKRKAMIGTYGSEALAEQAMSVAKAEDLALVVCFIRQVSLSIKWDMKLSIDTDLAAQKTFSHFLERGHEMGVPVIPVYDTGPDAAVLLAENAAIYGCQRVLIGTSRQGAVYHLVKGSFQRRLESLLPPEIPVEVMEEAG